MNLAMQAAQSNNIGRVRRLLNRHWPEEGYEDLRDWEWRYLWQISQSDEVASLQGHSGVIYDMALSPDGRLLASSCETRGLHIQDISRGEMVHSEEKAYWVTALAFNHTGKVLALACWDGVLRFLDPLTGTEAHPPIQLKNRAVSIAYSPQGTHLATAGEGDEDLILWSPTSTGYEERHRLRAPRDGIFGMHGRGLSFSPDENWLAVTRNQGFALIDLRRQVPVATAFETEATIDLAFSPDSSQLAQVGWKGEVGVLRKQEDGTWKPGPSWKAHKVWIPGVLFADDQRLVTVSADQLVKVWNADTGEGLARLQGHRDEIASAVLSPDGNRLYTGSKDGELKHFALNPPVKTHFIEKAIPGIALARFSANQRYLGLLTISHRVMVLRSSNLEQVIDQPVSPGTISLAVSDDGASAVVGNKEGQVQRLHRDAARPPETLLQHDAAVNAVCMSPGGNLLATVSMDKTVRLFNFSNRTESVLLRDIQCEGPHAYTLAFSEDATRLSVSNWQGVVEILDLNTREILGRTPKHTDSVWQQIFLPGTQQLACVSSSGYLTLWGLDPLEKLASEKGQLLGLHSISVCPNGRRLAVGTAEGTVKLWSTDVAHEIVTLDTGRHYTSIEALAVHPDGTSIIAAEHDNVFLWRAPLLEDIPLPANALEENEEQ